MQPFEIYMYISTTIKINVNISIKACTVGDRSTLLVGKNTYGGYIEFESNDKLFISMERF